MAKLTEEQHAQAYLESMVRQMPKDMAAGYVRRSLRLYEEVFGAEVADRIRQGALEQYRKTHGGTR